MIFLNLFITFFKIGLFGFGGGYGMLSLIQHETVESHHWLSTAEFTDIVAISQMTPGPIGINSATYCGYTAIHNAGYGNMMAILGSATSTFALVLPSLILMILISKMFMKYMKTHLVQSVFTDMQLSREHHAACPLMSKVIRWDGAARAWHPGGQDTAIRGVCCLGCIEV